MKLFNVLRLPALLAAALLAPAVLVEAEHTSNWAVLVCTSRFWFNYRHLANVLSIYRTVKRLGIPDSQIILMLPDDMACNPRNAFPGTVYSNADRAVDLYGDNIEVDYRGYEVTVENFIRLLTDRVGEEMPRSKRLLTDDRSNILVYMTGHGGNEFLKFQDAEEIGAFDLADAFEQMWEKKRYHEILFMIDTCQANTMYSKLYSPNIIATGSSKLDQSSYSHHADNDVGVAVIDRYTYYNLEFLETEVRDPSSKKTVGDLFDSYTYDKIHSDAGVRYDLFPGGEDAARSRLVTDFFGNVQNVEVDGSKNTTLEEDLLSLSRSIAALRQRTDEEEEAAAAENKTETTKSNPAAKKRIQFAKPLTDDNWWTKKIFGASALAAVDLINVQFLPLREINLNSRPIVKRAIAFSCDGELAVAADDSVHVFVPEFPDLASRREDSRKPSSSQHQNGTDNASSEEDEDNAYEDYRRNTRAQYSEGSKHMPVSFPPLDPRVNKELFSAAGLPFPYDTTAGQPGLGSDDEDDADDVDDEDKYSVDDEDSDLFDSEDEEGGGTSGAANRPFGAGYGPITGVGSSMNHVVRVVWSPSGLGINRRPILAVLTGAGMVAMYGDGSTAANIFLSANDNMLQRRELGSWIVLWGVGERLVVPGQQTELSENIQGLAWARGIGPGQALLATINDLKEVAIISIQTVFASDDLKGKGSGSIMSEPRESVVWLVREIDRFKADGPHPKPNIADPDFVPCGTSFGLNWSPWVQTKTSRTCLLSYVDRNYVGFRRITIPEPWIRGELPKLTIDKQDAAGRCLHLSTDAFVEFEDAVTKREQAVSCRGLIVTGFHLKNFEVDITGTSTYDRNPHHTNECGTTYLDELYNKPSENPIVDLFIHPPDPLNSTTAPIYTLIRMSATASNSDWYETNVSNANGDGAITNASTTTADRPQWARDIAEKLEISIPADMRFKHAFGGGGEESDSDDGSAINDDDSDLDDMDDSDSDSDNATAALTVPDIPEIHPHRFRLHGLSASPGGGSSVVIVSNHSTQHPERGGWHTVRSSVLFAYKPRRHRLRPGSQQQDEPIDTRPLLARPGSQPLTTEAQLFEWLYGGGPEVPGINISNRTTTDDISPPSSHLQKSLRDLRAIFAPAVERQTCDLCGARMTKSRPLTAASKSTKGKGATTTTMLSGCDKGHFFGTCATSGLAIQIPGITRSCGACGLRTINAEKLAEKMPEMKEEILREMRDGVCGGCGGKFLN
ncbi:gpi-anchor transamidase-like protein [Podospora didyma]|uniref:Gpi-anchor transamidase-like protein n=1 Tax=Podospora didyma TaxID=330526 RepID=A0AAE0U411_9PEZI|nr:gpi-anchor transamidase-like protein [Podospora didyma]